ncbi:MAG: antitermination protein NusG [Gammaproteobacteria bacterium]|nr:antitermination protein NusG [Gammaproteobacteria bacterium]
MIWLLSMFMKILLTVLVIIGAVLVVRSRKHSILASSPERNSQPAASFTPSVARVTAYSVLLVMVSASGYFVYRQWQESGTIVTVHVVDVGTGNEVTYQAFQGDVGARSFKTTDGRVVNLAEVERMELGNQ